MLIIDEKMGYLRDLRIRNREKKGPPSKMRACDIDKGFGAIGVGREDRQKNCESMSDRHVTSSRQFLRPEVPTGLPRVEPVGLFSWDESPMTDNANAVVLIRRVPVVDRVNVGQGMGPGRLLP
jgi:hypothetical protein